MLGVVGKRLENRGACGLRGSIFYFFFFFAFGPQSLRAVKQGQSLSFNQSLQVIHIRRLSQWHSFPFDVFDFHISQVLGFFSK